MRLCVFVSARSETGRQRPERRRKRPQIRSAATKSNLIHKASGNEGETSGNHDAAQINALHNPHMASDIATPGEVDRLQTAIYRESGEEMDRAETVKHPQFMDEEG